MPQSVVLWGEIQFAVPPKFPKKFFGLIAAITLPWSSLLTAFSAKPLPGELHKTSLKGLSASRPLFSEKRSGLLLFPFLAFFGL